MPVPEKRGKIAIMVGIAMIIAGLGLYVTVPSMSAPLAGLILAATGTVTVVAALVLARSQRT